MIEPTSGAYWQNFMDTCGHLMIPRSCLYVGAHLGGGMSFLPELLLAKYNVTIVEAHAPNAAAIRAELPGVFETICMDIREFSRAVSYDLVIWWHGPEHLEKEEVAPTLERLQKYAGKAFVVGCPWGEFVHEDPKNPFEKHRTAIYPETLEQCGLAVTTFGEKDKVGSQLIGMAQYDA